MTCARCKDKELAPTNEKNTIYLRCTECERPLNVVIDEKQRTTKQNKAIHKWSEELATELNNAGLDMREVLKPEVDIPWDKETIKRYIIHPIIKAKYNKESTADLTTKELTETVDIINRHLINKFSISMPFPSIESMMLTDYYD